jgi:WD40 repeat protein
MADNNRGIGVDTPDAPVYERGTNYFLGISIDTYNPPFKRLRNCVNDINVIQRVLTESYDFEAENMLVLRNEEATRRNILKTLQNLLLRLDDNDSLIFMYSGHGDNLRGTNVGFMIPVDAEEEEDFINLSDVKSRLDASKAKHIFVIFDACFSGLLLTQRDARAQNLPENFPSRYAMTSGRNHPVDDGVGEHSPFAKALIDELTENDDSIGSVMLAQRILDRFRRTGTDDDQLPAFGRISGGIEYEGQYYFYPKNYELSAARERTKRLEAEQARKVAETALVTAEQERKRAEKLVRAATNTAAFMQVRESDQTKAVRMMQYNTIRHPESQISHDLYTKTLVNSVPLYQKILRGHTSYIYSAVFSPDGTKVLTGSWDFSIKLWDVATGTLENTFWGEKRAVNAVAFSPLYPTDAKFLSSNEAGTVNLWDITTGEVVKTFKSQRGYDNAVAFLPNGQKVLTISPENNVILWDIATQKAEKTFVGHTDTIMSIAVSPNGQKLLTGSKDCTAKLWDIKTEKLEKTFDKHKSWVTNAVFSPIFDENNEETHQILTGSYDKTALLWDIQTGEVVQAFSGNLGEINDVAFSPDGQQIATASYNKTVKLWDKTTGQVQKVLNGHTETVPSVAFSPDGSKLLTCSADKTAKIWSLTSPTAMFFLDGHLAAVEKALYSPNGKKILTFCERNQINLWDLETNQCLNPKKDAVNITLAAAFLPESDKILIGCGGYADELAQIWDTKTGEMTLLFTGQKKSTSLAVFSPDGSKIFAYNSGGETRIGDIPSNRLEETPIKGWENIISAAFSPDNKKLVTGNGDGTVKLWDLTTQQLEKTLETDGLDIRCLVFSSDGKKILRGGRDKLIKLWNAETYTLEQTFWGHASDVKDVAFSLDGQKILSGSWDKTAKIWSITTGLTEKTILSSKGEIHSVAFSTDPDHVSDILLACNDKAAELWDLSMGTIEDYIATFPLYELMEDGLMLETADTPQYIEELVAAVANSVLTKDDAVSLAQKQLENEAVVVELKRKLEVLQV